MLVIFAGLPGTGKSTPARALAKAEGFTLLHIDSIEQALHDDGVAEIKGRGYAVATLKPATTSRGTVSASSSTQRDAI